MGHSGGMFQHIPRFWDVIVLQVVCKLSLQVMAGSAWEAVAPSPWGRGEGRNKGGLDLRGLTLTAATTCTKVATRGSTLHLLSAHTRELGNLSHPHSHIEPSAIVQLGVSCCSFHLLSG